MRKVLFNLRERLIGGRLEALKDELKAEMYIKESRLQNEMFAKRAELLAVMEKRDTRLLAEIETKGSELYVEMEKRDTRLLAEIETKGSELYVEMDMRQIQLQDIINRQKGELQTQMNAQKGEVLAELQDHKTDKYSYDHESIRAGFDYLFANLQLAFIEHICPGNRLRLEAIKDTHKGERCFVIGNGPSLKATDLDLLKRNGVFCFASNRINLIYSQTNWRPDVWGVQDADIISTFNNNFEYFESSIKISSGLTIIRQNILIPDAIYFPHIVSERLPFWFSKNIVNGIMDYPVITGVLINIAAYMGFSTIYLLGVDNTIGATKVDENGVKYYDFSKLKHFTDSYNEGMQIPAWDFAVNNKDRIYQDLKAHCEYYGIKLYNATRGGELEVLERVKFEDVINEKTDKI